VDFEEYSTQVAYGMIPLWNLRPLTEKTSTYPNPCVDKINYEHQFYSQRLDKDCAYLVRDTGVEITNIRRLDGDLYITCPLERPCEWNLYEVHQSDGESQCACRFGGVITIVPAPKEEADALELEETEKTRAEFEQMLQQDYGFDEEQAQLISKAFQVFMDAAEDKNLSRKDQLHTFFSEMASLCVNYSGSEFKNQTIFGTETTADAMDYFVSLGLTEQEVFDLMGAINFQHSKGELGDTDTYHSQGFCCDPNCSRQCGYAYHITDSKYWKFNYGTAAKQKDFAHEIVQYASFSNESLVHNLFGAAAGNIDALSSYKGDIYSKSMGLDDINSDIDAVNIYQRLVNSNGSIMGIMTDYSRQAKDGTINRADEFLMNLGDGNIDAGLENLKNDLLNVDLGSHYLAEEKKTFFQVIQDALYQSSVIESNVILLGEETFNEVMDFSNQGRIKNDAEITDTRNKFITYLEDMRSKEKE